MQESPVKTSGTTIFKMKEILKDHMCIEGEVSCSLLQTGTVQEVKGYCRKLNDIAGKDGGFIMSTRSPVDDVKIKTLRQ